MNKIIKIAEKLKLKWGFNSYWQVLLVCLVFALAGSSILWVKQPIFDLFGYGPEDKAGKKVFVYLIFVFPLYQAFLLIYGFLLGQFKFFWEKEKKLAALIARPFKKK
jgi:hypothetical protein